MYNQQRSVAIDVMGSDAGPEEILQGILMAVDSYAELANIVLVGDSEIITKYMAKYRCARSEKISVVHASEVIAMDEKPLIALKTKKDSSMLKAIELVKNGSASAMLSCGNTGSLMAGSTLKIRMKDGVDRPALASIIPSMDGRFILVDVGANPNSSVINMAHNAVLASVYCKSTLKIEKPRVSLLTIGTEEGKGNDLTQLAHEVLKKMNGLISYIGLVEGFQLFDNYADVVVCDGFVGNILLKALESVAFTLANGLKHEIKKNPLRMFGALLASGAFRALKSRLNPEKYGAAPLLGLKGIVLKAHGSSNKNAIKNAVKIASDLSINGINEMELDLIAKTNEIIGL
ncbi:MAG: phosphate acyltransferase PlsX [Puniceicoccales bacterium]|jgi:glycerol-3-phosphate acyltransferase PlsX|nr:phosphate acyltransferase PlsX [Puniceicoccales bacterium]